MAKADVKSAFHLLPIHTGDFCFLCIKVLGKNYVDRTLPIGVSFALAYFIEWVVNKWAGQICHYVDDFFVVGGATASEP